MTTKPTPKGKAATTKEIEITDYKSACKYLGQEPVTLKDLAHLPLPTDERKHELYHIQCTTIVKAMNKKKKVDFSDYDTRKYRPWMYYRSGVGLSFGGVGRDGSSTVVAPRLCNHEYDNAEKLGKMKEYENYMNS